MTRRAAVGHKLVQFCGNPVLKRLGEAIEAIVNDESLAQWEPMKVIHGSKVFIDDGTGSLPAGTIRVLSRYGQSDIIIAPNDGEGW